MALVSGRGSNLNPNAPPFIPAAYRKVEDFSSQWWNLVQNSVWFRDYWLSEHGEESFNGFGDFKDDDDDITDLLPDTFDVGYDDFVESFETRDESSLRTGMKPQNGMGFDAGGLMKNSLNSWSLSTKGRGASSLVESVKYNERPAQRVNPKHGPRYIHQPR